MKITIEDLKKAMKWIDNESLDMQVKIDIVDNKMVIKAFDKYQTEVEISLYEDGSMLPKIKKTDILR